jgi:hypothetical protein
MRDVKLFNDYLNILASVPHKVTRLDASVDVEIDTSIVLSSMRRRNPSGKVSLTNKPVPVSEVIRYRPDGTKTGTYYIGQRGKASITAVIYDKQMDNEERYGYLTPVSTRYELRFARQVGCTLRDAADPTDIFWHHSKSFSYLKRPGRITPWTSGGHFCQYEAMPPSLVTPAAELQRRVECSDELYTHFLQAEKLGRHGVDSLIGYYTKRLRQYEDSSKSDDSPDSL